MREFTVGETITNPDVGEFTIIAISTDGNRTLLLNHNLKAYQRYIGAYLLDKRADGTCYWSQGHYFGDNLKGAVSYILEEEA